MRMAGLRDRTKQYALRIIKLYLDESLLWLELLVESTIMPEHLLAELMKESDELLRIIVKAIQSTKARD